MTLEPLHIPDLLKSYHLQPQKSLGQNFLADHNALVKIVDEASLTKADHVLEIGAGLGSLTRLLAEKVAHVTAVEIDQHLLPVLEDVTRPFENVHLIRGDILKMDLQSLFDSPYIVVANIPYYITSAVIRHLLEARVRPNRIILTIQREVAERICRHDQKMSLLSLSVLLYGRPTILHTIPASCFYPRPKVDSSVLLIDVFPQPRLSEAGIDHLFKLAHAAFNQKRKMLRSSLKAVLGEEGQDAADVLTAAGIDPKARPEVLEVEDWTRLVQWLESG